MKCDEFETRLNELLDARASLEGDEQLRAHAAICESCRQDLATVGMIVSELAHRPRPMPSAGLATRVVAEFTAPQVEHRTVRRVMAYAFAAAAVLLIAAFPAWRWWNDGASASNATLATVDVAPTAKVVVSTAVVADEQDADDETSDPPIGDLVREVSDRYKNLARDTQESYAELALLLPGVRAPKRTTDAALQENEDAAATEAVTSEGWVNDMANGLKPVTDSTMGAFSFLLEALPTEVPSEKL
jgi:Putative zinc-finger